MLSIKIDLPSPDYRIIVPLIVIVFVFVLLQRGYTPQDVLLLVGGGCAAAATATSRLLPRVSEARTR